MKTTSTFSAALVAIGMTVTVIDGAIAQGMQGEAGPGMMQRSPTSGMMDRGTGMMADQGIVQGSPGPQMMGRGMGPGMMMMCPAMMRGGGGTGMMMDSEMMGSGMTPGGMGALFGSRVTPMMNLSVEDVRGYLASRLDRLNNKRLKIGNLSSDDGTITAEIVTVDNSLVQRLKIDRRTGTIDYES
jgi:hypothetical protein